MNAPLDESSVASVAVHAIEALERREYALAAGLVLMVATFFVARFRMLIPKEYVSTVLLGASVIGGFGAALASGVAPGRAALVFLACSSTAIAFWEGVAKHLVKLWTWKKARRRVVPPRKFPTILAATIVLALTSTAANAGERLTPGVILVRPDGSEVVLEEEAFLLESEDVAKLDSLLTELQTCRESRDACKREHEQPRSDRKWVFLATLVGAFLAGFAAQQQVRVTAETVEPP